MTKPKGVTRYYEIWILPIQDWWTSKTPTAKPRMIAKTKRKEMADHICRNFNATNAPGPDNIRAEHYIRYSPTTTQKPNPK